MSLTITPDNIEIYPDGSSVPSNTVVEHTATLGSNCVVESGVVFTGGVTIGAHTSIAYNVRFLKQATVGDEVTFGNSARFRGTTSFGNDVKIGRGASFATDVIAGDRLIVGDRCTASKSMTAGEYVATGRRLRMTGSLTAKANSTVNSHARVDGDVSVEKNARFGDNAWLGSADPNHTVCYITMGPGATIGHVGKATGAHRSHIHGEASLADGSCLGHGVCIITSSGQASYVGANSVIGDDFTIRGLATIGSHCKIGRRMRLFGDVTVRQGTQAKSSSILSQLQSSKTPGAFTAFETLERNYQD